MAFFIISTPDRNLTATKGGRPKLPFQSSTSILPCPLHPPGACLIKSRPDLCKRPWTRQYVPLRSCCRLGSQEIPSLWVIYRGVQSHFLSFLLPSNQGLLASLFGPLVSAITCCTHGGSGNVGDSFQKCLRTGHW